MIALFDTLGKDFCMLHVGYVLDRFVGGCINKLYVTTISSAVDLIYEN
jgi:hypothetical protein